MGPICVNGEYRRGMNHELYKLYDDVELVMHVKIEQLRWLGHVIRMDDQTPAKRFFKTLHQMDLTGGEKNHYIGETK